MLDSFYFDVPVVFWDGIDENGTMIGGSMEKEGAFTASAKHFDDAARLVVKDGSKVACDLRLAAATATPTATATATPAATATPTPSPTAQPPKNADSTAAIIIILALLVLGALLLIGRKRR